MTTRLKELLADRNLREVSRRSGVAYSTVRRAATGRDVRLSTAQKLADYLRASE